MRTLVLLLLLVTPAFADHRGAHWTAPTTNVDGSPLSDLAGFKVYVCARPATTCTRANAVHHATTPATDTRGPLPAGEGLWFVTAFDFSGNESAAPAASPFDYLAPSVPTDLVVR